MTETFNSLSVVIPIYNAETFIDELIARLETVCEKIHPNYEIILVNDGSRDNTWNKIKLFCEGNSHIVGINLSRNFGQPSATAAALLHSSGDIVVLMDDDLQDPPENIPLLIEALIRHNTMMAVAQWSSREDSYLKLLASKIFFHVNDWLSESKREPRLGNFRAIRKSVIDGLRQFNESTSHVLSIVHYIAGNYICVPMKRDARSSGESGYTISKMFSLATTNILSFSLTPIRFATYSGFTLCLSSLLLGIVLVFRRIYGAVAPGWTSIIVVMFFLFGLSFAFLGILGEYIGRIFIESRQRPRYIISEALNIRAQTQAMRRPHS
ncbi:MAG: glycosyltransferase family 2 protein [Akkermansia muciniphila]|nr:glycosyltransferase family 2 protein [Akkermansia muciniphila]